VGLEQDWKHFARGLECVAIGGPVRAQAIRRRVLAASVRVLSHVISSGIYGERSDTEADFLRSLLFPLPNLSSPNVQFLSSVGGWGLIYWAIYVLNAKRFSLTSPRKKVKVRMPKLRGYASS
jgi:hypothetical protein